MSAALATSMFLCAVLDRRALATALGRLKHLVPRRSPNPALECVLVEGASDALYLTASNGKTCVRVVVPATVTTPGTLLMPLRRLAEIVRGPGASKVHLAGDRLAVAHAEHRVVTQDPAQFPPPEAPRGELLGWYERPVLARMLAQSAYAMSADDTRPHLHALLLTRRGGELAFVATDGHRLSLARCPDDGGDAALLVGRPTIDELARLVSLPGGPISVRHVDGSVWFASAGEWVCGPLIDEAFPAYEQVIPEDATGRVTFVTVEFAEVLRALAPKGSMGVTLSMMRDQGAVRLHVDDGEGNRTEACLTASFEGSPPSKLGCDARYLRDLLGAMREDDRSVTLALRGDLDPVRVDSASGMTAVVMPMRV